LSEPLLQFWRMGDGGQAAGGAEGVVRKTRMNLREVFESGPGGNFGDSDVRIAGDQRFAVRRIDDADGEARSQERKERGDFFLGERVDTVISRKDRGSSRKRIFEA